MPPRVGPRVIRPVLDLPVEQKEEEDKEQQVDQVNAQALEIVNALRKKKGLPPLPPELLDTPAAE